MGCSDSDSRGDDASKAATAERSPTGAAAPPPKVELSPAQERAVGELPAREAVLARDILTVYRGMSAGEAKTVCAGMTPRMRKRNVGFTRGGQGTTTCEQVIGAYLGAAGQGGDLARWGRMKLVDVQLRGTERGTITLTFGKQTNAIPVRKIAGSWKIDGSGTPVDRG